MGVYFNPKKKPIIYRCGHCHKLHFGSRDICFYANERYYCNKYISRTDESFVWNKNMSAKDFIKFWYDLNIDRKMKVAKDLLLGTSFRYMCNGQTCSTFVYNVLRIDDGKIYLDANDEYSDIYDMPYSELFTIFKNRKENRNTTK